MIRSVARPPASGLSLRSLPNTARSPLPDGGLREGACNRRGDYRSTPKCGPNLPSSAGIHPLGEAPHLDPNLPSPGDGCQDNTSQQFVSAWDAPLDDSPGTRVCTGDLGLRVASVVFCGICGNLWESVEICGLVCGICGICGLVCGICGICGRQISNFVIFIVVVTGRHELNDLDLMLNASEDVAESPDPGR